MIGATSNGADRLEIFGTGDLMSGTHDHGASARPPGAGAGARYQSRLLGAFALISAFFLVEVVGGILSGSLALLSDAAHMFTDVIGLGMALAAIRVANHSAPNRQHTFGRYRLEVLAAAANAVLLLGVGLYILFEAFERFQNPPEVLTGSMLGIALAGLAANLGAFALLREGAKESLNVQGAFLEVIADTLGSLGVILAAVVIRFTGWTAIDPLIAAGIGLFVVPRTLRLGRQALRILMQSAPENVDVEALCLRLERIPGVDEVHDLHVWTLSSGMDVGSVHLRLMPDTPDSGVLDVARAIFRDEFGIDHATIQVEKSEGACKEMLW